MHGISIHHDLLEDSVDSKLDLLTERHAFIYPTPITNLDVESFAQRLGAVIPHEIKQVAKR